MRSVLVALALLLVSLAPGALAGEPEPGYYVRAEAHPVERPAERSAEYDCGAKDPRRDGLDGALAQTRVDPMRGWVHPAECLSLHADASADACPQGACPGVALPLSARFAFGARAAYNVTSGQYFASAAGSPAYGGNSGVGLAFDCAHCPPPWAV